jgi:glycosyltransferase involved in cell wall biosynthesis
VKVLHVSPVFYPAHWYGGPIQSGYHLCRHLPSHGCDVRILTTNANGMDQVLDVPTERESELHPGMRITYCKRSLRNAVSPSLVRLLPSLARWADVVHLTALYSFPTWPTLLACRLARKPLVWSLRGALRKWSGTRRKGPKQVWEGVCRLLAPRELVLHCCSEEEMIDSAARFPWARTVLIPNGVQLPDGAEHAPPNGTLRLLYLGRLHPQKGIDRLLDALALLEARKGPHWSLSIAGPGTATHVREVEAYVQRLQMQEKVRLVGEVVGHVKRDLFLSSDLLVLPSHRESFGQVVAEALAHGVPVLASTGTPWKSLAEKGCGLWVDNDPATLADAIERMSRMRLRDMGVRGREWMRDEFSWESRAGAMAGVYRELLQRHRAVHEVRAVSQAGLCDTAGRPR